MHRFHGLHYLCVCKFTSPFQLALWEEQAVPKALADLRSELALGACPLPSPAVRKTDIPSHQAYSLAGKAASGQGMKSRMRGDRQGKSNQPLKLLTMTGCRRWEHRGRLYSCSWGSRLYWQIVDSQVSEGINVLSLLSKWDIADWSLFCRFFRWEWRFVLR